MKTWIKVALAVVVVLIVGLWYWFRPDRIFSNVRVDEAMPAAQGAAAALPLESGTFYTILHPTSGTAMIYKMPDGTYMLRFTNFDTSNGPDVHVYMVAADDAKDAATVERAGSSIWVRSKETSATKTTYFRVIWIWRNIARYPFGANDSA